MTKPSRIIRIAIQEPSPDWWQHVKRAARHHGTFVSRFVIIAIEHYLEWHTPELAPPVGQGNQNGKDGRSD